MHFFHFFSPVCITFGKFSTGHEIFPLCGGVGHAAHTVLEGIHRVHRVFHARIVGSIIHGAAKIPSHAFCFANKLANFAKNHRQFFGANYD